MKNQREIKLQMTVLFGGRLTIQMSEEERALTQCTWLIRFDGKIHAELTNTGHITLCGDSMYSRCIISYCASVSSSGKSFLLAAIPLCKAYQSNKLSGHQTTIKPEGENQRTVC